MVCEIHVSLQCIFSNRLQLSGIIPCRDPLQLLFAATFIILYKCYHYVCCLTLSIMVAALEALTVMDTIARVIPTAATTNTLGDTQYEERGMTNAI